MLPEFDCSTTYNAAQIMMTHASITYAAPNDVATMLANPSLATQGQWRLVWGPGVTTGNLMYVAQYMNSNIYAIAIRGTVPKFGLTLLVDLYEDLDVGTQVPWGHGAPPDAKVAYGTLDGLSDLASMVSNGQTLLQFIATLPDNAAIFVTGHSLGGCLTTVMAPWLQFKFAASKPGLRLLPMTFAGPTAGNQAFADWYTQTAFPGVSFRYYNTLDIIPMAWQNLVGIKSLYPQPAPDCPWEMRGVIDMVNGWLVNVDDVAYVQPNGNGNPLPGTPYLTTSWFTEAGDQHGHNTYLDLLGAPQVPITDSAALPVVAQKYLRGPLTEV